MSEIQNLENEPISNDEPIVITNKYELIAEWLKEYTPLNKYVYFNVTPFESDNVSLNSVSGEAYLDEFIDGTHRIELLFSVNYILDYDELKSDLNLRMNEEFISLNKWVNEQDEQGNYPDFVNCIMEKVEPLTTTPTVTRDTTHNLAKYQGEFKITFIE